MTVAQGISKQLIVKKQSALGTAASGSGAQILRRITSTIDLAKGNFKSNEIRTTQQRSDFRLGERSVSGTVNGELSVGTYQKFMESVLRQLATPAISSTGAGLGTVTPAVTSGASGTFTRSAGSWITDGYKVGMVVQFAGFTTTGVPNNAHNFLIKSLSATVMTGTMLDGVAINATAGGASAVSCLTPGKFISIPLTGHTKDYWTIEHNFPDLVQSEQFIDCIIGGMNLKLPASGLATVDFPVVGLDMTTGTASVFTSPTAISSGLILASVNGAISINGVNVGNITSMDININGNAAAIGAVVGTNASPDVSRGSIEVTGTISGLFDSITMRDLFINETACVIQAAFTTSNVANADFIGLTFPAVKITSATKDDGEKGITSTYNFTALEYIGSANYSQLSTIVIQDSQAV
jgi:hypothetical protein